MGYGETTSELIEKVAKEIVDAAFKIHRATGPGLLESIYEIYLCPELLKRGLKVARQVPVPLYYEGERLPCDLKIDLLVEDCVIIEIKAVGEMHPIFKAQILTYLKLANLRLGFLINFNVEYIKDGITRVIR